VLSSPGYSIRLSSPAIHLARQRSSPFLTRSIDERSLVYFVDSPLHIIEAYVESGEGIDRAGGFAIQVCVCKPRASFSSPSN
jgi:predicted house-cleaning NTP pyrophosphatase (Maf/HAM1 superfamily)